MIITYESDPARLQLIPHVNAPVADLPVKQVIGGMHFIADLTLPYGRVLHDYMGSK
ncbi:acetoacetate decarboxylase family protein [Cycloclasticus sp.]|uniref:acetoacetate decarboxylase family protein n=1 Tax=Cycloclasticus sp. TaxID=2024830 RepID=UPI002580A9E5|nr:acetoacetate decarboxylase family protein [Cycloclasticus sp.]